MKVLQIISSLSAAGLLASCAVTSSIEPYIALGPEAGLENWSHLDGRDAEWTRLEDGAIEVKAGTGNIVTRVHYGDARIELEFMCPVMPNASGQGRGNSGVYVQSLYELQVLDSYGIEPGMDTCGAIYKVSPAMVNACKPPGEWQHYAIEFTAPRLDEDGAILANARMTAWQNGTLIQDDVEIPSPTGSAAGTEARDTGPVMLQDHGNPVRYRNVQITPRFPDK
jgi:hypothetical protein